MAALSLTSLPMPKECYLESIFGFEPETQSFAPNRIIVFRTDVEPDDLQAWVFFCKKLFEYCQGPDFGPDNTPPHIHVLVSEAKSPEILDKKVDVLKYLLKAFLEKRDPSFPFEHCFTFYCSDLNPHVDEQREEAWQNIHTIALKYFSWLKIENFGKSESFDTFERRCIEIKSQNKESVIYEICLAPITHLKEFYTKNPDLKKNMTLLLYGSFNLRNTKEMIEKSLEEEKGQEGLSAAKRVEEFVTTPSRKREGF